MDFLRVEGEFNFLTLLPPETRLSERARWYEGRQQETEILSVRVARRIQRTQRHHLSE